MKKTQQEYATDKKHFHEILFAIDKALSALPIRLERIRVRNQRNLSMINSYGFQAGDSSDRTLADFNRNSSAKTVESPFMNSFDSNFRISMRMQSLFNKLDKLNLLIESVKQEDSSLPIEVLVDSELLAISLLKKEIDYTKKQIDDNKTDTNSVVSDYINFKDTSVEGKFLFLDLE